MNEHNNDTRLQQLLHEKLEEHTVPAPDFVWPAIEKELFPPAKKRRPVFWWFVFSGLFLGVLSFFFLFPATSADFSFDLAAAPIRKTIKPLQSNPTIEAENKNQFQSTKSNAVENDQSGATTIESSQPGTKALEKNNGHLLNTTQSGIHSTTKLTKPVLARNPVKESSSQKPGSNPQAKPVVHTVAHRGADSLIANTTMHLFTAKTIAAVNQKTDSNNYLAFSGLLSKTITFKPDTVKLIHPFIPLSIGFSGYSFINVYWGIGRNRRTYSGIVESHSHAYIIDRTLKLKNTNFGIDYNYQFLPFASARIGINMGTNRYTTRLFPIRIANTSLNDELDLTSPSGELKSAPLDLADQASQISDTTTFLMRIVHRSHYFSVPLSIRFNTTNTRGPQLYGFTGFDFMFRGKDQNTLIVRKSFTERSFSTSKPRETRGFYPGWHLGAGLASNPSRRLQFYGEFNYSQVFGDYYTGKVISIRSNNVQLNAGLRIKL